MFVMVGLRGESGINDEPQHFKQGEVLERMLDACDLLTVIVDAGTKSIEAVLRSAVAQTITNNQPVVRFGACPAPCASYYNINWLQLCFSVYGR